MKKDITLKMISTRYEVDAATAKITKFEKDAEPQRIEMFTEAVMTVDGDKIDICYDESELSGLEGSSTHLIFDKTKPDTLTMFRDGEAATTMVFSPGLHHTCTYHTPIMPFRMELFTRTIINRLHIDGTLELDYITELAGSGHARTFMNVTIFEDKQ
ncbi:MAG: DUF1934 domain-containing protein [Clostridia bacterium]|nr:DUF1934 domain-containing protein [Clostridia bacterium]